MKYPLPKFLQIKGAVLGIVVSLIGMFAFWTPDGFDIEEQYGLEWLFRLRGSIAPPTDVVIIALDRKSAHKLDLSEKPDRWPRSLHGQLIKHLQAACAKTIVFDLFFREAQEYPEDQILAQSMKAAKNVVLTGHLGIAEDEVVPFVARSQIQTQFLPTAELATVAVAVAPFVLPNTAYGVTGYWPFMVSAGDLPTLPSIVFYLYLSDIREILNEQITQLESERNIQRPDKIKSITTDLINLRGLFINSPDFSNDLLSRIKLSSDPVFPPATIKKISGFINLLKSGNWFYLNFYGPPRTIKTVAYSEIIKSPPSHCHDTNPFYKKIVLIGVSESSPVEQKGKDIFETVFPGLNGLKMSGVEIMATAINNLIENSQIRRINIPLGIVLIVAWGMMISIVWRSLKTWHAFIFTIVVAVGYISFELYLFQTQSLWLPLIIPLIQTIFTIPTAIAINRAELEKYIKSVHTALSGYLPASVIEQIIKSPGMLHRSTGEVHGTCLHTDVAGFTSLCSEKDPLEIGKIMTGYFHSIARPVLHREGIVADQTGDCMLALWVASKPDIYLRHQACEGALDIAKAVEQPSFDSDELSIPTRIGLHAGCIAIGEIRFDNTRQLRSFGSIVNLSQRLESLNKELGTQILISEDAISGLNSFLQRPVGTFLLQGMNAPLNIYELVGRKSDQLNTGQKKNLQWLCDSFSDALLAYTDQQWQETVERLIEILDIFPDDGPALFYLKRTEFLRNNLGSVHWDPVIYL